MPYGRYVVAVAVALFIPACFVDGTEPEDEVATESEDLGQAECKQDSDCRAQASYCGGCSCEALAPGQKATTCPKQQVACFADPCRGRVAKCSAGTCVLASGYEY